jgi:hypothetical protein
MQKDVCGAEPVFSLQQQQRNEPYLRTGKHTFQNSTATKLLNIIYPKQMTKLGSKIIRLTEQSVREVRHAHSHSTSWFSLHINLCVCQSHICNAAQTGHPHVPQHNAMEQNYS